MIVVLLSCQGQEKKNGAEEQIIALDQNIWTAFQDSKGNNWYGSNERGLYRYDGKDLINYTTKDGLLDNSIRKVHEDHQGNIYIETHQGVSKYMGGSFRTLPVIRSDQNQWKLEDGDIWLNCNGNANDIYLLHADTLYGLELPRQDLIAAFGADFDPTSNVFGFNVYSVFGVDMDAEGNLWIGTCAAGAFRFDSDSFLWSDEKELTILEDGRVPGVRAMIQDNDGYFWLSNLKSKYRINDNGSYTSFPELIFQSIT